MKVGFLYSATYTVLEALTLFNEQLNITPSGTLCTSSKYELRIPAEEPPDRTPGHNGNGNHGLHKTSEGQPCHKRLGLLITGV